MKIGIIQSRGIGDIIIALPIAKFFADCGNEVYWPIDQSFIPSFRFAAPYVAWIPLKHEGDWFFQTPLKILEKCGCQRILPLYSYLTHLPQVPNPEFSKFLKFDEYKYAIAGVPFREKWNLHIVRNYERENELFKKCMQERNDEFVVAHLRASDYEAKPNLAPLIKNLPIIQISPLTDNIFDWLTTIERASLRIMVDSCFSNLTEQLRMPGRKIYIPKLSGPWTPVLLSDWQFLIEPQAAPAIKQANLRKHTLPSYDTAAPASYVGISKNAKCPCGSGKKYKHCHAI